MPDKKRAPTPSAQLAPVSRVSRDARPRRRPPASTFGYTREEMIARANICAALMMLDAETFRLVGSKLEGYARYMKRRYPGGGLNALEQRAAEYFDWFRSSNGR